MQIRKKLSKAIFLILSPALFAETFFSGETGVSGNFSDKTSRGFDPALNLNAYFAGQLTLSNAFSVRGEFSLLTGDMFEDGFTNDVDGSIFRVNEFSATFTKSFGGFTHTLSAFMGYFEAIGSQDFVRRHLGVKDYSTPMLENYLGQNGTNVYSVYGKGGAYSLTMKNNPLAFGLAVYKNDNGKTSVADDVGQLNADLRFATAFRYLTLDMVLGISAPVNTKTASGDNVVLLIDTLYLHAGIDMLIGNKYDTFSLYLQNGFEFFPIRESDNAANFSFSDMYLLVEPRLNGGKAKMYLTAFSFPDDRIKKMIFFDDTLGVNLSFFGDAATERRDYTAGFNLMVSFEGKHFNTLDSGLTDALNAKIAPFARFEVAGGELTTMLQVSVLKIADNDPNAIKLNVGYKKEL